MLEVECRTLAGESWCIVLTAGSRVSDLRNSIGLESGKLFADGEVLENNDAELPPPPAEGGALVVHVIVPSPAAHPVIEEPDSPTAASGPAKVLFPLAAESTPQITRSWRTLLSSWMLILAMFGCATFAVYSISGSLFSRGRAPHASSPVISEVARADDARRAASKAWNTRVSTIVKSEPPPPSVASESFPMNFGWVATYTVGHPSPNHSRSTTTTTVRPLLLWRSPRSTLGGEALSAHAESMSTGLSGRNEPLTTVDHSMGGTKIGASLNFRHGAKALLVVPLVSAAAALVRPAAKRILAVLISLARRWLPAQRCHALARFIAASGLGVYPCNRSGPVNGDKSL